MAELTLPTIRRGNEPSSLRNTAARIGEELNFFEPRSTEDVGGVHQIPDEG